MSGGSSSTPATATAATSPTVSTAPNTTASQYAVNSPYSVNQLFGQTAFFDPTTGQSTLPAAQQAMAEAAALQTPEQFQTGTNAIAQGVAGTQALQNYTPQQIAAQNIQGAQTGAYQMQTPAQVAAQQAQVASMAGPQQWDTATANQYMNPYTESALAAQQSLANMNYAQQNNQLMGQATGMNAYGGSRAQLALAMNTLNQNIANQNLAAQGMNTAYTTGQSAFQNQNQLQQTANQANQQAYNTAYNNYVAQGMTAAQANQAAQLAAGQANLSAAQQTSLANLANTQAANVANQQTNLTAQTQNQQAGLTANQQNLGAANQLGTLGTGLGNLGQAQNQVNLANIGALGQSAAAQQNLAQQYLNTQQQNAQSWFNMPNTINTGAVSAINGAGPSAGGTTNTSGTAAPASAWKKGGSTKKGVK